MTAKKLCFFIACLVCQSLFAQQDTLVLKEVVVTDMQLKKFSSTQNVITLNDSVLKKNQGSLTALLQFNSGIYFKENGLGSGVASASFRGTTAQQTAVVWNGININSQINGQTDFNTIATSGYSSVSVRSGGGSVIYGSSAIGGSVHLDNDARFGDHFENEVEVNIGSFNTQRYRYSIGAGSKNFGIKASAYHNSSDNDYEFPDGSRRNLNAQFENSGLNVSAAYKISAKNFLKYSGEVYDGERHFPLLTPSDTKTKYRDYNLRNLLEWVNASRILTSRFKLAYLRENYQYFENLSVENPESGTAETAIAKYDGTIRFGKKATLNAIFDYTQANGRGSDVDNHKREISSGAVLFRQQIGEKLRYELGVRKEITSNYDSPILYSGGIKFDATSFYSIGVNASRNFRIPTFNDLYWADGGNPDLKPESSYQAEIGNDFKYKNVRFSATAYYMKIIDMIQWLPGTIASWFPQNVNKVEAYGAEALLEGKAAIGKHKFSFSGTYSYTVSENEKTKKQLIYVPYHKATAAFAYNFRKLSADVQSLFNGEVFTRSDNNSRYNLDAYSVLNAGVFYNFGKKQICKIGFQVKNILDADYQTVERRPYPGRNYNVSLTLNF